MKRILFFCLLFATSLFSAASNDELNQPLPNLAADFVDILSVYKSGKAEMLFNLGFTDFITVMENIKVDVENTAFYLAIRWLSLNVGRLTENDDEILLRLRQLLLAIRFKELTEPFIKHIVAKTPFIFVKKQHRAKEKIADLLYRFYWLTQETPESMEEKARAFGYQEELPSRATLAKTVVFSTVFEDIEDLQVSLSANKRYLYYANPIDWAGYTFSSFFELKNVGNQEQPFLNIQCSSKILDELTALYTEEELKIVEAELGQKITTIKLPASITFRKFYSKKYATQLRYAGSGIFESTAIGLRFPIPNKAANWKDALSYPIASKHIREAKDFWQSLVLRAGDLVCFDKLVKELDQNLNAGLVETDDNGKKTIGFLIEINPN